MIEPTLSPNPGWKPDKTLPQARRLRIVSENGSVHLELDASSSFLKFSPDWACRTAFQLIKAAMEGAVGQDRREREAIREQEEASRKVGHICSHPDCDSEAEYDCSLCNQRYCFDLAHGWPDAPTGTAGETASICWRCQADMARAA